MKNIDLKPTPKSQINPALKKPLAKPDITLATLTQIVTAIKGLK